MLTYYGADTKGPIAPGSTGLPADVNWIDAFDPSPDEMKTLTEGLGTRIPTHDDLVEIESSSRLSASDGVIVMSLPATIRDADGYPSMTPVGFVVTPDRVATLRFARLPSFENLAKEVCAKGDVSPGGLGATVTILEIIVDHVADLLERIGGELDAMSRSIFLNETLNRKSRRGPRGAGDVLHTLLRTVGRTADLVSKISETPARPVAHPAVSRRQRRRPCDPGAEDAARSDRRGRQVAARVPGASRRQDAIPARRGARPRQHRAEQRVSACSPWSR